MTNLGIFVLYEIRSVHCTFILANCLTNDKASAMMLGIMLENARFFSFYFYFAQPPKPLKAREDCLP